jgi:type I restriction enzyme R subunit
MNNNNLSESDISDKFIRPAIVQAGWNTLDQIYAQYPLRAGRVVVRGKTAKRDKATVLRRLRPVLQAQHPAGGGGGQKVPPLGAGGHAASHSLRRAAGRAVQFCQQWRRLCVSRRHAVYWRAGTKPHARPVPLAARAVGTLLQMERLEHEVQSVAGFDYALATTAKTPRYYQLNAINRTVEAIAAGQNRVLLVMATGTGKTYTAFQIIHRLWKSPWRADKPGGQKRILFLADRNILIDQTMVNDFRPFKGAMAKLSPNAKGIERINAQGQIEVEEVDLAVNRTTKLVDKSYEIYLSLYQAVSGTDEAQNIYKQFSPNFFDLIVVDECHRGSADEDSAWREILTYFSSATQLGLTATPKETKEISNSDYFGDPIYTYSLKQGIEDGYLAPYKVIRVDLDKDAFGWRPTEGMTDKHGNLIEDRIYTGADMNRKLVLEKRDEAVAAKITEYLKATDRYAKTIVFCEDIDHAARMRQALSNANADICATHPKYVVQITGDNPEGKRELDNFIDPEKTYPVIATTSKLMSTGVDAQTCKLIVLDQNIKSMTLFKQIIGRGTRLREDLGKTWFTILDFKRATELFADKDFDGEPVQIYEPKAGQPIAPPDTPPHASPGAPGDAGSGDLPPLGPFAPGSDEPKKYVVGGMVTVAVARERVQYLNAQGKLITESLRDYTRINLTKQYDSLDKFLQAWNDADRKAALLQELESQGVLIEALAEELASTGLTNLDPFDLLLHVAYNMPPLTRRERASRVKKRNVFTQYGPVARKVIDALLDKYADEGIATIEADTVFNVQPFTDIGRPAEIIKKLWRSPPVPGRPANLGTRAVRHKCYVIDSCLRIFHEG